MKKIVSLLLVCVMICALAGCSASKENDYGYVDSFAPEMSVGSSSNKNDGFLSGNTSLNSGISADTSSKNEGYETTTKPESEFEETTQNYQERKIVYSVTTSLQTKKMDEALNLIKTNLSNLGGYIQSEEISNNGSFNSKYQYRNANLQVRVPSGKLEEFLAGLENENLYTVSLYKDSQDYSEAYYDKETRIANLKIQEERLLELLESASDIKTMLDIEERLSNIRYNIESLTKDMNIIDSKVEYSSVTIKISEVVDYTEIKEEPKSFFEEVKEAVKESWEDFVDGCQDFTIWLIHAFPALVIWAIIIFAIVSIIKKRRNKKKAKRDMKQIPPQNDAE